MENVLNRYNQIINTLQQNDSNANYDEILGECNNDLNEAIRIVISCLDRALDEEFTEDNEERAFYLKQYNDMIELQK